MKYLVSVLFLLALFTLSVGTLGSLSFETLSGKAVPIDQQNLLGIESNSTDHRDLKQSEYQTECENCQPVDCPDGSDLLKAPGNKKDSFAECAQLHRFILPMDLFLLPIEEKAPSQKSKSHPILSKKWKDYFQATLGA